jgi:integrase
VPIVFPAASSRHVLAAGFAELAGPVPAVTENQSRRVLRHHSLCRGASPQRDKSKSKPRPSTTVRELGERWTSGELHADYPDQIRLKRTVTDDVLRLERYVYPVIGPKAVAAVTLDDAEAVMRALPAALSPLTRRNIGQALVRLLNMAVYPLRLIERSPIPKGFLPKARQHKALAYLYPDEDRRLMACPDVPLCFRLLWGFLIREGMRAGEALALTWTDIDLDRGAVRLDRNKTDDPRAWALSPGVAQALKRYFDNHRPTDAESDLVFTNELGRPLIGCKLAGLLRDHLTLIGLRWERPELFKTTAERQHIRVHDLRGSFVTIGLANGRSEAWIADRKGHRSSQMIARYKRTARTFAELGLGDLTPLNQAIPELADPASESAVAQAVDHDVGHPWPTPASPAIESNRNSGSQLPDLNRRPAVYETAALPLS